LVPNPDQQWFHHLPWNSEDLCHLRDD